MRYLRFYIDLMSLLIVVWALKQLEVSYFVMPPLQLQMGFSLQTSLGTSIEQET